MQNQLIKLGFLSGEASGRYDSATADAVLAFKQAVGVEGNGSSASASLIAQMFNYVQPTATPAPTATATPAPTDAPTATPAPDGRARSH